MLRAMEVELSVEDAHGELSHVSATGSGLRNGAGRGKGENPGRIPGAQQPRPSPESLTDAACTGHLPLPPVAVAQVCSI
jgi:hypothetical protein